MSNSKEFQDEYRKTIGRFTTGVTVLIAERDGLLRAMTANAVSSLSLEPTQLLICPSKQSRFSEVMAVGAHFTMSILGDHQEDVSNFYARSPEDLEDAELPCELTPWESCKNVPRLSDCIAALGCRVHAMHEGGDHWIVVADVLDLYLNVEEEETWPLLFYGGRYQYPSRGAEPHLDPAADPYE